MSKKLALEKVGRARVAYKLMQLGWRVGEAYDDGYDLLAYNEKHKKSVLIELKTMDIDNRKTGGNLTAVLTTNEIKTCTHIIIYVEPDGFCFIAPKNKILTSKGSVFASLNNKREFRAPRANCKNFSIYKEDWNQLFN